MCWLQGIDYNYIKSGIETAQVKDATLGHMLGNSLSLNVVERILREALLCAGLISESDCVDRWVGRRQSVFACGS